MRNSEARVFLSTCSEMSVLDISIEKNTTPDAIPTFPSAERRPKPNILAVMCSVNDPCDDYSKYNGLICESTL